MYKAKHEVLMGHLLKPYTPTGCNTETAINVYMRDVHKNILFLVIVKLKIHSFTNFKA